MTLTLSHGPLSPHPPGTVNYELSGPAHRLLLDEFPRRVRARFAGETVLDTRRGVLLHETGLLPQLYVPEEDFRGDLLEPTDHSTHCPFKGDASYWSVTAAGRTAENAVWAYQAPLPGAGWLRGYRAAYWQAMDQWFDEDEEVFGHLRDPYHRVDVRRSSARVRVTAGESGEVLAETARPLLLSETGLPNRWYIPRDDIRLERLRPSTTTTVCPYKGTTEYWSLEGVEDVAWSYPEPLEDAVKIAGYVCFAHEAVRVDVDHGAEHG
jgi:uncharacterized protein (DUF427 family)